MNAELKAAIEAEASADGWDPLDLPTAISYETQGPTRGRLA